MKIYEELQARGLIAQVTDEPEIRELINNGSARFYIGFDPTADSLHVGHFMALCLMKRLQMAGNKPIVLIGGGTGHVGDPSGRTDMRSMMTKETIDHNCDCFKKQMERFIEFGPDKAVMVNNADWLLKLNYVELLREVGGCFSVNNMLRAECYKQRMEKGLSFLEFNYMIMQAYDFYYLHQHYDCNMQFGGNDQWSNMLAGTELIRKKTTENEDAYAMTITLLMNSEGKKMGKTAKGAVWLDPDKTSPFEFYQYWRNTGDADVLKCIRMLTFLPLEEIDKMDKWEGSQLNEAKEILAYELTGLVHGKEEADKAKQASHALFAGGGDEEGMPSTELSKEQLTDNAISILELMMACKLAPTKSEARRLVTQGGVTVDGEKATLDTKVTAEKLIDGVKIRKGKKVYHKALLKS
ncbi:MAG: tyrosine--tRNA ligase [Lachnospiraceae bacterium]|jgi:tyrosyl-tRNA synthetase|nr:tyrosine--tRNA ligase [Lachnospiraceae bacterium]